jgi:hypothetical protein
MWRHARLAQLRSWCIPQPRLRRRLRRVHGRRPPRATRCRAHPRLPARRRATRCGCASGRSGHSAGSGDGRPGSAPDCSLLLADDRAGACGSTPSPLQCRSNIGACGPGRALATSRGSLHSPSRSSVCRIFSFVQTSSTNSLFPPHGLSSTSTPLTCASAPTGARTSPPAALALALSAPRLRAAWPVPRLARRGSGWPGHTRRARMRRNRISIGHHTDRPRKRQHFPSPRKRSARRLHHMVLCNRARLIKSSTGQVRIPQSRPHGFPRHESA